MHPLIKNHHDTLHTFAARLAGLIVVLLLLALSKPVEANENCPPLQLGAADGLGTEIAPGASLQILRDPRGELTIADVARGDLHFAPLAGGLAEGFGDAPVWLRLCLRRASDAPEDWLLVVLPPFLRNIVLFTPDTMADSGFSKREQGAEHPFSERDYPYRGFTFSLKLPATEPRIFYLRLQTSDTLTARFSLRQPAGMAAAIATEYSGFGLYLGMTLLVATINALFWFWLRDRIYGLYAAAVTAVGLFSISTNGYAAQFLPGGSIDLLLILERASFAACSVFFAGFTSAAFQLRRFYPRLYRINRWLIFIYLPVCFAALLSPAGRLVDTLMEPSPMYFGLMSLLSLHGALRHRELRLYAVAFLPVQLSMLVIGMRNYGLPLPDWRSIDLLPHWGGFVHMILLNVTLARRAWRSDRDKQQALALALQTSREAEHSLELRVAERTRELDRSRGGLMQEITERKQVENRLQQALDAERTVLRQQRQFLAMMSHEFRTPLATVRFVSERLARQSTPETRPQIDKIQRNTERMLVLIENLLTEERMSSAAQPLRRELFDLAARLRQRYAGEPGQTIRLSSPATPVLVTGDPQLLDVVISNLVDNALKYSGNGPVELTLAATQAGARLWVRDYGPGLTPAEQELVFGKFYRGENTAGIAGTGLGLHLARELARRHGGDVHCELPTGAGALFCLYLPRVTTEKTSTENEAAQSQEPAISAAPC